MSLKKIIASPLTSMFSRFSINTVIIIIIIIITITLLLIRDTLSESDYVDYGHNSVEPYIAFGEDVDANDYRYTLSYVGVAEKIVNRSKSYSHNLCTGSLISKDVILTAAHCVFDISKKPGYTLSYYAFIEMCASFGLKLLRKNDERIKNKYIKFESTALHPNEKFFSTEGLIGGGRNFDIMIIILPSTFDDIHEFSQLYGCREMFMRPNSKRGKHVEGFAIGCGVSERKKELLMNKKTINQTFSFYTREPRRIVHFPITFGENECMKMKNKGGFGHNIIDWKYSLCNIPPNRFQVCTGDSGGPFFIKINGKVKQIGICRACLSHKHCRLTCGCYDLTTVHTFAYAHKDWIINLVKSQNRTVEFEDCTPKSIKPKYPRMSLINVYFPKNAQCMLQPSIFTHITVLSIYIDLYFTI